MNTGNRYQTRSAKERVHPRIVQGDIQQYFTIPPRTPPGTVSDTLQDRGQSDGVKMPAASAVLSRVTNPEIDSAMKNPASLLVNPAREPACETAFAGLLREGGGLEGDIRGIRALLSTLPTCRDIEALIIRVEETHRQDIQAVRSELTTLTERTKVGEETVSLVEQRVETLEKTLTTQTSMMVDLQLHTEELEDRSRRNNLWLRGLPETRGTEDLQATVIVVFQIILKSPEKVVDIDRVHRAAGPRLKDSEKSRDIVCQVHSYQEKERILRAAWGAGDIDFNGTPIKILPDICRATLQRRACLRPILELAKKRGCTYRWGYPLAVRFRSINSFIFCLCALRPPGTIYFSRCGPYSDSQLAYIYPSYGGAVRPLEQTKTADRLSKKPTVTSRGTLKGYGGLVMNIA